MHRILQRQLRRAGIDPDDAETVPRERLDALLQSVEASYRQADDYRYLQEQALAVSSREMADFADRTETARREQEALRQVATAVAEGLSGARLFNCAAQMAGGLADAAAARVFALVGDVAMAVGGWAAEDFTGEVAPGGHLGLAEGSLAARLIRTDGARSADIATEPADPYAAHLDDQGISALIAVPIQVNGKPWGALTAMLAHSIDEEHPVVPILERLASLLSVAIINADAKRRLERLASVDDLTGLATRRVFHDALRVETGTALSGNSHLSLVLIDFDDFKLINDQLGHQAGDKVLTAVASVLSAHSPENATLARLGGDEFAWLLPGLNASSAAALIEQVQERLESLDLSPVDQQTVSAGVCDLDQARGEPVELYRMADGALYATKRSRPGTCTIYRPDTELPRGVSERRAQLERSRSLRAVRALAKAVDARDPLTQSHSERVADLAAAIAAGMGWSSADRDALYEAALVHDVGKIGVPDEVLSSPGALTADQWEQIKLHPTIGAEIVSTLLSDDQVAWVRHHHERWDGEGYPGHLSGIYIPLGARIMAVADTFDAMVSDRPYRAGLSPESAVDEIRGHAGRQFDPELVAALLRLWEARNPLLIGAVAPRGPRRRRLAA